MARKVRLIVDWVDEGEEDGYQRLMDSLMSQGAEVVDEYDIPMDEAEPWEGSPRLPKKKEGGNL